MKSERSFQVEAAWLLGGRGSSHSAGPASRVGKSTVAAGEPPALRGTAIPPASAPGRIIRPTPRIRGGKPADEGDGRRSSG